MEAILTLHQAGNQLGVEDTTLSRLIRVGGLPEARKVNRPEGLVWVIPQDDLPEIARRNGWTIDLRDGATELLTIDSPEQIVSEGEAVMDSTTDADLDGWDTSRWNQAAAAVLAENDITSDETPASGSGTDRDSAIEVSIAATPVPAESDTTPVAGQGTEAVQSMVEALDLALLERLLEAQEGRVSAEVLSQENKHALAALNVTHNRATAELEVERRERMMAADRYREERMARAVADAKVAELRDRLVREMALADTEKAARTEALTRSVKAERDAATAMAAMGWRARRRYRKLNAAVSDQVVVEHQQAPTED